MKNLKEFIPLWKFIKEDKGKVIIASLIVFIVGFANTFIGYLNGRVVEAITKLQVKESLMYLLIYLFLELFVMGFLSLKGWSIFKNVENKISRRLSFNTYKKALDIPAYGYEKTSSGEIINRVTNDTDTLSFSISSLINMLSSILGAVVIFIYVIYNSYIIGLEIVIFIFLIYLVIKKYNPILTQTHKDRKKNHDKFSSLVNESIRGIREIKTLGVKDNLISNIKEIIVDILNVSNKEIDISKRYRLISKVIRSFLEVSVFATCVILLYYGRINLTFFIAMTYYIYTFMYLIDDINDFTEMYQKTLVSVSRVNEILENKLYKDEKYGNETIKDIKGKIIFEHVNFGYPNEGKLLNDFNIELCPNKKIAIVGASGQGKSTIFNLITRIFDPDEGNIYIDGYNIKDLSEKELRKQVSIIRQDPFIFNRSIIDNFKLINNKITLEEIRKYTKMSYLDDYIMSLPKKYNTIIGEGGVNLSGGQKQRLSIARSLAKKSKIILFDEATSALDNGSQQYIKKSIDNLIKDHTVVIIAHRLSTIIDSDIIFVIDDGKVVDKGKHKDLLKKCSIYRKLYETESLNSEMS